MIPNSNPGEEYKVEEIEGDKLQVVELNGPDGPFEVAFARSGRENEMWLYRRQGHQFFFYSFVDYRSKTAEVTGLSPRIKRGWAIRIEPAELAIFKRNIKLFFTTRVYMTPWNLVDSAAIIEKISFNDEMSLREKGPGSPPVAG
jgi:hypothetical protein